MPMLAALHVAVRLGCNPIVLVGADHCFATALDPDDPSLASVTVATRAGARSPLATPPLVVQDLNGDWVGTTPALVREALAVAGAAELVTEHGIRVVNASGRGLIGGRVEGAPLADVLRDAERAYVSEVRATRAAARKSGKRC
jgi:hypothetical protein